MSRVGTLVRVMDRWREGGMGSPAMAARACTCIALSSTQPLNGKGALTLLRGVELPLQLTGADCGLIKMPL